MVKLKLGQISTQGFMNAMQGLLQEKLPVRTAFRVKGLVNKFNEELKKYQDLRRQLLDTHCKKDEKGAPVLDENQNYTFEPDKLLEITKEMNELNAIEVEVIPIKLDELGEVNLTAQQLFDLGELVVE